ncbi:uncharacterized protein LOC132170910 [Corylus avellana]|uniref:uncharacterized protein LOC132170910 n=1 Tax=Corylus avellana TaxID=13451 RepID=UPI00286B1743|nr:uncharacterized protein LOC132170910 [Corylus avellana]
MEKLAFTHTIASRKLRSYFQAHMIRVLIEYSLRKVLRKLDLSERLANWAIEIREFDIEFLPRNSIKGQALADFLAKFTNLPDAEQWLRDETWVVYVDGSYTRRHGGTGVKLITPEGEELRSSIRLEFRTTNNEAEYAAIIAGLGLAQEMGAEFIELRSDSQNSFKKFCIVKIPREENEGADHLARIASIEESVGESEEIIQTLSRPTIAEVVSVSTEEAVPDWQKEVVEHLEKGILPAGKKSAIQLRKKATRFTMVNGTLYKRGFMLTLLKCVSKEEGNYILCEIHEGICGGHLGARMFAHKGVRAGFYWPNMTRDSVEMVEVEALVNITAKSIEKFLWKNVVCRYGIPHAFVTDNGKQLDCDSFKEWCAKLHIRNYFSSLGHLQAHGQVEITNKSIFKLLKKKLGDRKRDWAEDLIEVLWAYRTTRRTPTEETSYALAFGTEAIIPAE